MTDEKTIVPKQEVMYFRLTTGDELVGYRLGEDEESTIVVIKSPMLLSEVLNPMTQSVSITLSKFMIFSDYDVLPIKNEHIISMTRVIPELEEFYHSSVTFNREVASKEVASELARANRATKYAIETERHEEGDEKLNMYYDDDDDEELLDELLSGGGLPSNTTIH